jgi:hypothetical protein
LLRGALLRWQFGFFGQRSRPNQINAPRCRAKPTAQLTATRFGFFGFIGFAKSNQINALREADGFFGFAKSNRNADWQSQSGAECSASLAEHHNGE